MEPTSHDLCLIPYPMWDRLRHMLSQERVQIRDLSFDEAVSFTLLTLSADRERILQKLDNLASGQAEHLFDNETFEAWPVTQSPEQSGPCP